MKIKTILRLTFLAIAAITLGYFFQAILSHTLIQIYGEKLGMICTIILLASIVTIIITVNDWQFKKYFKDK